MAESSLDSGTAVANTMHSIRMDGEVLDCDCLSLVRRCRIPLKSETSLDSKLAG